MYKQRILALYYSKLLAKSCLSFSRALASGHIVIDAYIQCGTAAIPSH